MLGWPKSWPRAIQHTGARAGGASDGKAARALLRSPVDLLFTDLQMPELDGCELTRALRAEGFALPVIAVTADVMPEDQARAFASGVSGSLPKPYGLEDLARVLRKWLPASAGGAGAEEAGARGR